MGSVNLEERKNRLIEYSIHGGILCDYTAFIGYFKEDNVGSTSEIVTNEEAMDIDDNITSGTPERIDFENVGDLVNIVGTSNTEECDDQTRAGGYMRRSSGSSRPVGHMPQFDYFRRPAGHLSAGRKKKEKLTQIGQHRCHPHEIINMASFDGRIKATDQNIKSLIATTKQYWNPDKPLHWERVTKDLKSITDESSLITMIILAILSVKFVDEKDQFKHYWE